MSVTDTLGRHLRDLRVSVTDRCNFRCVYCMPKEVFGHDYSFLERRELLTFEEIVRVACAFVAHGVEKIRITGGEPLVRRDLEILVGQLASIPGLEAPSAKPPAPGRKSGAPAAPVLEAPSAKPPAPGRKSGAPAAPRGLDLTLTTNGALLPQKAQALKDAGLRRVTVSLDSLDGEVFAGMNDVDFPVQRVLEGIDAASAAGLPVKVNMVVKRGVNEDSMLPMARMFRERGHILRFIEYMDVGHTNGWRLDDVVPAAEIVAAINAELPLEPAEPNYSGEVARRWRYADGSGEIGVIASVTQPFCGGCTRARLSAEGKLYTCLFGVRGHDLRALIRGGASDDGLAAEVGRIWTGRTDRYSEIRSAQTLDLPKVEMSYIGG